MIRLSLCLNNSSNNYIKLSRWNVSAMTWDHCTRFHWMKSIYRTINFNANNHIEQIDTKTRVEHLKVCMSDLIVMFVQPLQRSFSIQLTSVSQFKRNFLTCTQIIIIISSLKFPNIMHSKYICTWWVELKPKSFFHFWVLRKLWIFSSFASVNICEYL